MMRIPPQRIGVFLLAAVTVACCSCRHAPPLPAQGAETATVAARPWIPHGLPAFAGDSGQIVTWADLIRAVAWADVIVLGEEHDDSVAQAFQAALAREVLASWPNSAIALEMIERDEQQLVDSWLEYAIDEIELLEALRSTEKGRAAFAQASMPLLHAARDANARAIAANATRKYVRLARVEGWEYLRTLNPSEAALFEIPVRLDQGRYRQRLEDLMRNNDVEPTPDDVDAVLRAQQVWDRTMSNSVLRARKAGATKVILVIGRFHGDFHGGILNELRAQSAHLRLLYISTLQNDAFALQEDDRERADIVIYTGGVATPEEEPEEEEEEEEVKSSTTTS